MGGKASPEQVTELNRARDAFEEVRPHGWLDAEAACKKDTNLAHEVGTGRVNHAIRALQLETELRADRFVARWHKLAGSSQRQLRRATTQGYRATRSSMGDMAKSFSNATFRWNLSSETARANSASTRAVASATISPSVTGSGVAGVEGSGFRFYAFTAFSSLIL